MNNQNEFKISEQFLKKSRDSTREKQTILEFVHVYKQELTQSKLAGESYGNHSGILGSRGVMSVRTSRSQLTIDPSTPPLHPFNDPLTVTKLGLCELTVNP